MRDKLFKLGERVLLPCTVMNAKSASMTALETDFGTPLYEPTEDLLPAPREGEFRLTLEDINALMQAYCGGLEWDDDDFIPFARQWCENRRKEVSDANQDYS